MTHSNSDVGKAFAQGLSLASANLNSDGRSLWSYGWWEVARWVHGNIIRRTGASYSVTTAGKHRSQVSVLCVDAVEETPVGQGRMNL